MYSWPPFHDEETLVVGTPSVLAPAAHGLKYLLPDTLREPGWSVRCLFLLSISPMTLQLQGSRTSGTDWAGHSLLNGSVVPLPSILLTFNVIEQLSSKTPALKDDEHSPDFQFPFAIFLIVLPNHEWLKGPSGLTLIFLFPLALQPLSSCTLCLLQLPALPPHKCCPFPLAAFSTRNSLSPSL